jgi:hypothetical protein
MNYQEFTKQVMLLDSQGLTVEQIAEKLANIISPEKPSLKVGLIDFVELILNNFKLIIVK